MIWPADIQKALETLVFKITSLFVELIGNIIFNLIIGDSSYIILQKIYLERYYNYLQFVF